MKKIRKFDINITPLLKLSKDQDFIFERNEKFILIELKCLGQTVESVFS